MIPTKADIGHGQIGRRKRRPKEPGKDYKKKRLIRRCLSYLYATVITGRWPPITRTAPQTHKNIKA